MSKKQRGPLTPKGGSISPKAVVLSYSLADVRLNRLLPDHHIVAIAGKALRRVCTELSYDSPIISTAQHCYLGVLAALDRRGGIPHMGWLLFKDPNNAATGKNRLATMGLIAHAVWEYEGRLLETIPDYRGRQFILDDAVPFGSQMAVAFLDRIEDVGRCEWESNVIHRAIRLSAKGRLEAASDHRRGIEHIKSLTQAVGDDAITVPVIERLEVA